MISYSLPFSDVFMDKTGGNHKTLKSDYQLKGKFPIIDQGQDFIGGYTDDTSRLCNVDLPVIIFGDHTKTFKYIDFPFCLGADGTKVLKSRLDADIRFLFYAIQEIDIPEAGYSRHFKFLKRGRVHFPSFDEQKRIAAILDQAEELKQKRQRSLDLLEELKQSIFIDMFGDPFTNLKGFPVKSISSFGSVITGNTPSRQIAQNYGDHIEWIKSNNITPINIYVTKAEEFLSAKGASVGRVVPTGSILVTCIAGSRNSIGNVALTDRSVAFNQQINALLPNDPADTYFLFQQLYLNKELVREQSSGGMKGLVNKTNFSSIKLLDPPEQLKAEYNRKFQRLNLLAEQFKNSDTIINELFNSLQHKAFSGELSGAA